MQDSLLISFYGYTWASSIPPSLNTPNFPPKTFFGPFQTHFPLPEWRAGNDWGGDQRKGCLGQGFTPKNNPGYALS